MIERIAAIYCPNEKKPLEKARIGNVFAALLEINRQVLEVLELPGLGALTQFRLCEVIPQISENNSSKRSGWIPDSIVYHVQLRVIRLLWVQWILLVGEASIKVYAEHQPDEVIEAETLLDEMDQLQEEELPLSDEVRSLVEESRKNILLSVKPLPWLKVKPIYASLVESIARFWHPNSSNPLYEVKIYNLLKSLSGYLEWAGKLGQKPVLNKMLGLRVSHLTGARELTIPFSDNKFFGWVQKYQVGQAAKWSRTIFKALQKKQPAILFRDVAIGVVKEGGKRWLILCLHDKIADETNKLYKAQSPES
ncbi:MAG: hypothetical protein F3745_03150 [Nitrospinae bacterium]|nr:hypothetical protein [Nitrospinota bacterium]